MAEVYKTASEQSRTLLEEECIDDTKAEYLSFLSTIVLGRSETEAQLTND